MSQTIVLDTLARRFLGIIQPTTIQWMANTMNSRDTPPLNLTWWGKRFVRKGLVKTLSKPLSDEHIWVMTRLMDELTPEQPSFLQHLTTKFRWDVSAKVLTSFISQNHFNVYGEGNEQTVWDEFRYMLLTDSRFMDYVKRNQKETTKPEESTLFRDILWDTVATIWIAKNLGEAV